MISVHEGLYMGGRLVGNSWCYWHGLGCYCCLEASRPNCAARGETNLICKVGDKTNSSLGFDSQLSPKNLRGKIIDIAKVNQRRWLEECGQWLENVD